jgi:hypothetical protein
MLNLWFVRNSIVRFYDSETNEELGYIKILRAVDGRYRFGFEFKKKIVLRREDGNHVFPAMVSEDTTHA